MRLAATLSRLRFVVQQLHHALVQRFVVGRHEQRRSLVPFLHEGFDFGVRGIGARVHLDAKPIQDFKE